MGGSYLHKIISELPLWSKHARIFKKREEKIAHIGRGQEEEKKNNNWKVQGLEAEFLKAKSKE